MRFPWSRRKEIDEEVRTHLEMAIRERIERGESSEEAECNARAEFGNVLLVREATRAAWGWVSAEMWGCDLRHIFRQIRRSPGFAVVAILTLALGLGSTTAVFSIVSSVLLDPLNYAEPERLYSVINVPPPGGPNRYWLVNPRHFHEWRAHCQSCEDIGIAEGVGLTLTGWGEPERFPGLSVSYSFFRTLGVRPVLGRDFRPEEELPGQSHELILADSLWRSRFDSDTGILGRRLQINGEPHVVIGVMPPDFSLPVASQWGAESGAAVQPLMFRPLGLDVSQARPVGTLNFVSAVRLKPGSHATQASAELTALIGDFLRQYHIELRPALLPLQETVVGGARTGLFLLMTISAAVLLIVCMNVGNLILVRTSSRKREVGIRMALGSSRAQLFLLVLTEAAVLVAVGSVLGMMFSYAGLKAFVASAPVDLPRMAEVHMGPRVLLFAIAVAGTSALICGFLPALHLARTNQYGVLKSGSFNTTTRAGTLRFREVLVGVEIALSTVLLVVGGLLVVSFVRATNAPKGIETDHVVTQDVSIIGPEYQDSDRVRYVDEALEALAAVPGVRSVGVTNQIPLRGEAWICDLRDAGPPVKEQIGIANFRFVNSDYWTTLGIPLRKGRLFEPVDRIRGRVAVLSDRAAQLLWPGEDPIGKRVGGCGGELEPPALEVIGIVGDVRAGLEREAPPIVYQPYWTTSISRPSFALRIAVEPAAVIGPMRNALRSIDPNLPITRTATMEDIFEYALASRRFQTNLTVGFAIAALVLASIGAYGVISFTVVRRTPEFGIRIALGANKSEVALSVLRSGMLPVLAGLAGGLILALFAGRFVAAQLYGVTPTDPWTFAAVTVLLLLVALCACWIPARRAMRVDPLTALRCE